MPTVIRPHQIADVTYEPPLRVGFGINDQTVEGARATMGRTLLVPGAGPNPTHLSTHQRRVLVYPVWSRPSVVRPERRERPEGRDP